jgi:hypothetical protein
LKRPTEPLLAELRLAARDPAGLPTRAPSVRTPDLERGVVLVLAIAVGVGLAESARADIGLTITTVEVRAGGVLRGFGNASGMPIYLVPESHAPRPIPCQGGRAYCAPRSWHPPQRPYVRLGRLRPRGDAYPSRRFAFRVPSVGPGRYEVAVWC